MTEFWKKIGDQSQPQQQQENNIQSSFEAIDSAITQPRDDESLPNFSSLLTGGSSDIQSSLLAHQISSSAMDVSSLASVLQTDLEATSQQHSLFQTNQQQQQLNQQLSDFVPVMTQPNPLTLSNTLQQPNTLQQSNTLQLPSVITQTTTESALENQLIPSNELTGANFHLSLFTQAPQNSKNCCLWTNLVLFIYSTALVKDCLDRNRQRLP